MRVISGTAGGRKLRQPEGMAVRPTTDQVKEAIFNIIQFSVEGRRVLDLFAGTGQLGIEALSRGARGCTFVDKAAPSLKLVRDNLALTGFSDRAEVVNSDSIAFLERCGKYGIVLLDPPYETDLLEKALKAINQFDILEDDGIIICESMRDKALPAVSETYFIKKG